MTRYTLRAFANVGVVVLVELDVVGEVPREEGALGEPAIKTVPKIIGIAPLWEGVDMRRGRKVALRHFTRRSNMIVETGATRETREEAMKDLTLREASLLVKHHSRISAEIQPRLRLWQRRIDLARLGLFKLEGACARVRDLQESDMQVVGERG